MKRRFDPDTENAKVKLAAELAALNDSSVPKDKGKQKTETPVDTNEHKPHPPLPDLHSIPPTVADRTDRNRSIFRHWPRDPNGKSISTSDARGKQAGNGLDLWGATLYDFYYVHVIPGVADSLFILTGSKLANIMKEFGELDHARDELAWATREACPMEIPAWDPAQAILAHERRVHADYGVVDQLNHKKTTIPELSVAKPDVDVQMLEVSEPVTERIEPRKDVDGETPASEDSAIETSGRSIESTDDVGTQKLPSRVPIESPFHPSHYPTPWPLVPFGDPHYPFALQRAIPIHLLPKKLYVHDPWNLLTTDTENTFYKGKFWTSKIDRIRTFSLSLPPESQRMAEAASKAAAAAEDEALKVPETVFIPPQETEGPTEQPAIRAILPARPRKPTEVPEAHLYLSPDGRLGTGNHSIVYKAELELPRDLFCESTYCKSCLDEQIKVEVDRLKESGEWERNLNQAAKKYETTESLNVPSSSSVQIPPRYVGSVKVKLEHVPIETVDMVAAAPSSEAPPENTPSQHFARVSDSVTNRYIQYEGMVTSIHPNIQWQNPSFPDTICNHNAGEKKPVPRTAKFCVAAKLSLPGDRHLEREASNYLKFPPHFFQHWTGYNVVWPLRDPTPVGALVPQFFGYYTLDALPGDDDNSEYCSPILLMEHCGRPICARNLSIDDRHECASLLFRFHAEGWLHASFAERNILKQKHHPTCGPLEDHQCDLPSRHQRYSFRLIDFGRSVEYDHSSQRYREQMTGRQLFGILRPT